MVPCVIILKSQILKNIVVFLSGMRYMEIVLLSKVMVDKIVC